MKMRYEGTRGNTQGLKNDNIPEVKEKSPLKPMKEMVPLNIIDVIIFL